MSDYPTGSTRDRGQRAESLVADKLGRAGLRVVDRNFSSAGAEIDLIATGSDGEAPLVVFIEVRSRARSDHGSPLETVDARKQARVVRAAKSWLVRNDAWERVAVRFDVVGVLGGGNDEAPSIEWIKGAFEVDGRNSA